MVHDVRSFWDIGEESFRAVIAGRKLEVSQHCPGVRSIDPDLQDVIDSPDLVCMKSKVIERPVHDVWRWIEQVFRGGGVYGLPSLESPQTRSSAVLLDDLPPISIGDRMGDLLTLQKVDPGRSAAWTSSVPLVLMGHQLNSLGFLFRVDALTESSTQLTSSVGMHAHAMTTTVGRYLCRVLDVILMTPQLERLRQYAEADVSARQSINGAGHHQALPAIWAATAH